ncbi:MAG: hypothetical protein ACPGXJ_07855 [Pseudomonadales bacterium]
MTTLYMVKSNPVVGKEDEYNRWYNDIHLSEVLQIDGFRTAQRFQLHPSQVQPNPTHTYLAIYQIDSDDVDGTLANLSKATWMNLSDAIDMTSLEIDIYQAMGDIQS